MTTEVDQRRVRRASKDGMGPRRGASSDLDPSSIAPEDGNDEERAGFQAFQAWWRTAGPMPPPQSLKAGSGADAPRSLEVRSGADAALAGVSPSDQRRGSIVLGLRASRRGFLGAVNEGNSRGEKDAQGEDEGVKKYADDSYSYMALHGFASVFFYVGFSVWMLQMGFVVLLLLRIVHPIFNISDTDNPAATTQFLASFIPAKASFETKITQLMCLISYTAFADESLQDLITAVETCPNVRRAEPGDKTFRMAFSCFLRFTQGLGCTLVVVLLIFTSSDIIEIILNFAAVNFISSFDSMAFNKAMEGKYGPKFEAETKRIAELPAPACTIRTNKHVRGLVTTGTLALFMISGFVATSYLQYSSPKWTTRRLRVQIKGDNSNEEFNGCYNAVSDYESLQNPRYRYDIFQADETNPNEAKFGYCLTEKKWFLFKGNEISVCDAQDVLAISVKTSTFDISTIFGELWVSPIGIPLALYFFPSESSLTDELCHAFLGDGNCDKEEFNTQELNYDEGDCCYATCSNIDLCGIKGMEEAFGNTLSSENGFRDGYDSCKNPSMKPITIKLNTIAREAVAAGPESPPQDSLLILDCDEKHVLKVNIIQDMEYETETVMVSDGAKCTMTISNAPDNREKGNNSLLENMNIVTYTVYHGDAGSMETNPIVMFQGDSKNTEPRSFLRIRDCFFPKLNEYIDNTTIYTSKSPSSKAIKLLTRTEKSCDDTDFVQEYALRTINFGGGCDRACEVCPLGFQELEQVIELEQGVSVACEQGAQQYFTPTGASGRLYCNETANKAAMAGCHCKTLELQKNGACVEGFFLPLTEEVCAGAAIANGLSLGGASEFAKKSTTKGCYWVSNIESQFFGGAYFGLGGSDDEMQSLEMTSPLRSRLSCGECDAKATAYLNGV